MARVKRAVHGRKRHRAVLEQAEGYYGNRSRTFKSANEAVLHSLQYAYRDRRARKGDFRRLWIQRILSLIHIWAAGNVGRCRRGAPVRLTVVRPSRARR